MEMFLCYFEQNIKRISSEFKMLLIFLKNKKKYAHYRKSRFRFFETSERKQQ